MLAQEAARTHQHELIGTEHLLLGLLSEPRGVAYEVLVAHTGSEEDIRDVVDDAMPPAGETTLQGHIAFGADSSVAIEQALRASSDLGHDWVGTEHLLLGLIRTADSPAALILTNLGFTWKVCTTRSRPPSPSGSRPSVARRRFSLHNGNL